MVQTSHSSFSAGKLLVASPALADPLFGRSVCLVMHHDQDGAIGVLLNRPLQLGPNQLLTMLDSQAPASQPTSGRLPKGEAARTPTKDNSHSAVSPQAKRPVHFGGPNAGPVVALHNQQNLAEAETGTGVYVAAQKEHLQQLVNADPSNPMRLIIGHAAWKGGQLEAEIAAGLWYLLPATADRVFEADEIMWAHLVRTGIGHTLASWVGVDDTLINPNLN